jgi:SAM-dependent methyltransferase
MAQYDIFFQNEHPILAQKLLLWLNRSLFLFLRKKIDPQGKKKLRILEIGSGKGYFYQAVQKTEDASYVACDRNASFQKAFPEATFYLASVPTFPENLGSFDLIYAAYVVEHLSDGLSVADFLRNCQERLNPGGIVVLACPNVLAQRFEFWNMDYTHRYPTTARNMHMALRDAGFERTEICGVNGLLTFPGFSSRLSFLALKGLLFFYSYRIMNFLFGWIFGKKIYELNNPFYQLYCLLKQENLICLGRK